MFKQNRKSTLYDLINTDGNSSNILNPDDITHNELNEAMKNFKNHTDVMKVGHTSQNFLLAFIDEL